MCEYQLLETWAVLVLSFIYNIDKSELFLPLNVVSVLALLGNYSAKYISITVLQVAVRKIKLSNALVLFHSFAKSS